MNKFMLLLCFVLSACSSNSHPAKATNSAQYLPSPSSVQDAEEDSSPIGGWAPVFFTGFDKTQLDNIAKGLNEQRIKRAVISYPTKMQVLADQIHDYLESATAQNIPLKSIELKDTSQVKYNLTQVIVTLYFN